MRQQHADATVEGGDVCGVHSWYTCFRVPDCSFYHKEIIARQFDDLGRLLFRNLLG